MKEIIIMILALLLGSFGEYQRDAEQSTAIANAKLVHTVTCMALQEMSDQAVAPFAIEYGVTSAIEVTNGTATTRLENFDCDYVKYLGSSFEGVGYCVYSPQSFQAVTAIWVEDDLDMSVNDIDDLADMLEAQLDEKNPVGVYPRYSDDKLSDVIHDLKKLH